MIFLHTSTPHQLDKMRSGFPYNLNTHNPLRTVNPAKAEDEAVACPMGTMEFAQLSILRSSSFFETPPFSHFS